MTTETSAKHMHGGGWCWCLTPPRQQEDYWTSMALEAIDYRIATALHRRRTFALYHGDEDVDPVFVRGWQAATDSMARAILEAQDIRLNEGAILDDDI